MNIFDVLVIVIVSFCLIRGAFRGIVKEVSSIIGVLAGLYGAFTYYVPVAKMLSGFISNPAYQKITGFLLLFGGVFIAVSALGILIKMLLRVVFLGWVDRLSGAVFGLLKGVMICSIILMVLTSFLSDKNALIKNSRLSPLIAPVSDIFAGFSSTDMNTKFVTKLHALRQEWEKKKKDLK